MRTRVFTSVPVLVLSALVLSPSRSAAQCKLSEIAPSTGSLDDQFGCALALEGDVALVGARLDDTLGLDAGAVVVLERLAGTWVETDEFWAASTAPGDQFGAAIDLDGGRAVIGAPRAFE